MRTTARHTRLEPCRYVRAWNDLLRIKSALLDGFERRLQTEHGLSLVEYSVLLNLAEAEGGRMRMVDLAREIWLSKSGTTRLVDRLEEKGLVERLPCDLDRRSIWACLTASGLHRLEAIRPDFETVVREGIARRISRKEADALAALLEKLLAPEIP